VIQARKSGKGLEMRKLMKNTMIAGFTLATALTFSAPAFAIADEAECKSLVEAASRNLLKANVSDTQLTEIDGTLAIAAGKCTSGDLAGAQTLIDEATAAMAATSN
jgi:hypothetical protein